MKDDAQSAPTEAPLRFEQLLERLEAVVNRLEGGEQSLEQALKDFETGMALARQAGTILDGAEKRVEQLLEGRDGTMEVSPLSEPS